MNGATWRLWWLLRRRRTAGDRDPASITGVLAVIAFAATSAVSLTVVGGLLAFIRRAEAGVTNGNVPAESYVMFAGTACLLLLLPLGTLGAAAARLAMARRDARLAALRLAGATAGQVTWLTILDAASQALVGAVLGTLGYLLLLPLVTLLTFQARRLTFAELWVGPLPMLATWAVIVLMAVVSSAVSLRRVVVTPLGVAARQRRPGLSATRLLTVLGAVALVILGNVLAQLGGFLLLIFAVGLPLAIGLGTLNLVGPFVLQLAAKRMVKKAKDLPRLLAGRRILDDPKAAWRSVGGVAMATFIAGGTAVLALLGGLSSANPDDLLLLQDLMTGGMLTLAIAGLLAAVSTGVTQSSRVIDQRSEYRALVFAGADNPVLDRARMRETTIPLRAAVGTATIIMLLVMAPLIGVNVFLAPKVIGIFVASVLGASLLVLAGAWLARFVSRQVVADVG